ncbi:MAG TPA: hypothetical protein VLL76_05625 [Candidatus Omnitrophota bacterium]|nr:hypothetical protein [Candidatus Omnitrophota bacterium]
MSLSACTVSWVEPYDAKIADGLETYYTDTARFIAQMQDYATSGDAKGQYANAKQFYLDSGVTLDGLLMRARVADKTGTCVGTNNKLISDLVVKLVDGAKLLKDAGDLQTALEQRPAGNCTVQALYTVKLNNDLMAAIHQHNVTLKPLVAGIVKQTVEQGVRIALTAENSKK